MREFFENLIKNFDKEIDHDIDLIQRYGAACFEVYILIRNREQYEMAYKTTNATLKQWDNFSISRRKIICQIYTIYLEDKLN